MKWLKYQTGICIIMDLPTVPEIAAILSVGLVLICWVSLLTKRLHRKEQGHDPSSTLYLVRKWGPLTRNIIRCIDYIAEEDFDPVKAEANRAAAKVCENYLEVLLGNEKDSLPRSEGSTIVYVRRGAESRGFVVLDRFIPTPHLIDIFDRNHQRRQTMIHSNYFLC